MQEINDRLIGWCRMVYGKLRGEFPEFLIAAWEDQVTLASAIRAGTTDAYLVQMADMFASQKGATKEAWAGDVIEDNHKWVSARIGLSLFYHKAAEALTKGMADPATLPAVAEGVFTEARELAVALTKDKPESQKEFLEELTQMHLEFTQLLTKLSPKEDTP